MDPDDDVIGGEFELDPSDLMVVPGALESWWQSLPKSSIVVSTGRAALGRILDALRREDPSLRSFLLPSYICRSAIEAFGRANVSVQFYPVEADLTVSIEALHKALGASGARGILFLNYFGIPCQESLRQAFGALRDRVWIVEDCAAGGLLESPGGPIGSTGHFSFTSLRKYLPAPDGAVIVNRSGLPLTEPEVEEDASWVRLRVIAKLLRGVDRGTDRLDGRAETLESTCLALFAMSERLLNESGGSAGLSRTSSRLCMAPLAAVAKARRENFLCLLEQFAGHLHGQTEVTPLYGAAHAWASPLVFPITCARQASRGALQSHLAARRIFCPIHWPLPPDVAAAFPGSATLSDRILGLPVDQRYGGTHMSRIGQAVAEYINRDAR